MDTRPIGVFDSGVGGLTVVKQLHKIMPWENIVYFGDTGRVPYGTRSKQTIKRYAVEDMNFLLKHNVKAIVAACGTVSSAFSHKDIAELELGVPYTGVVVPSTQDALKATKNGRIGVIATTAAIRSKAYEKAAAEISPKVKVFGNGCPILVTLAENGQTNFDNKIARLTLEMYLEPIIKENVDTLILGCTHFPLFYDIINDILNNKISLINSGASAAEYAELMLRENNILGDANKRGTTRYYVTDSVENFLQVAENFISQDLSSKTEYVNVEDFE